MFNQIASIFLSILWLIAGLTTGSETSLFISTMFVATTLIISEISMSK